MDIRRRWDFMSASARRVRAEDDIGDYMWLPQSIRDKIFVD
ncbi:hypothetical protein ACPOL_7037 (plasmid) [Acidisarcina polymorpha]|uniref:Uncharacterized protein n=1 Tax=Acidisarcina polymorpha TaxID=2211140 RepID=A0A2Z5GBT0_9BACT|nr:hypothetical protein ACPOL_7037 [Acidisarcina polymorpha]